MNCPVCGRTMPPVNPWRETRRRTCSRSCNGKRAHAAQMLRQAEVDVAAVWRLTCGDPVVSTKAERLAAVADLTRCGFSLTQIASLLHVVPRSVSRYRAALLHELETRH